ncbi:MAG TPA: helix-turn-helix domain-containing protein [Solirubrobacteraceae bacterium]|nr:helix-turn-helix domain-containing protein [Solirubrobacteraceae bacterium]
MTRVADEPHLRADARRNRDALLAAAAEVFAREGLDAPLCEIARLAGVGQGTLYRRFASRQALIEAIADNHLAELRLAAARAGDGPEAFLAFFRAAVRLQSEDRGLIDLLAAHPLPEPDLLERRRAYLATFTPLLRRAQAASLVRRDLEPGDVRLLLQMMGAATRWAGSGGEAGGAGEAGGRPRALELVLDAMRPGA